MHSFSSLACGLALVARGTAAIALGSAGTYAALAASTITNTGQTVITGNVGISPGTSITGFGPGTIIGMQAIGTSVSAQAQADALVAYNTLAGLPSGTLLTGQNLGGKTLRAGVYKFATSGLLNGNLFLDAQNNPNAVFIFQLGTTITTGTAAQVILLNGALACNVYWQVGSSATLGTRTQFVGNILAYAAITLNTGVRVRGRLIALHEAITFISNTVTLPLNCGGTVNPPPPPPTTTTTTTPTPTTTTTTTPTIPVTVTIENTVTSSVTATTRTSVCYTRKPTACPRRQHAVKEKRLVIKGQLTVYNVFTKWNRCTSTQTVTTATVTPACTNGPERRWDGRFE
jgi:hypothetical protein